jgi:hypothetical protein
MARRAIEAERLFLEAVTTGRGGSLVLRDRREYKESRSRRVKVRDT